MRSDIAKHGVAAGQQTWVTEQQQGKRAKTALVGPNTPHINRSGPSFRDTLWPTLTEQQKRQDVSFGDYMKAIFGCDGVSPDQRAMLVGTPSAGGYLVPEVLSLSVIDYLLEQSVGFKAGINVLPLEGFADNYKYASIASLPTVSWLGEAASSTTYDFTIGEVVFAPKTCRTIVVASRELLEDSQNAGMVIQRAISLSMADAVDRCIFEYDDSSNASRPTTIRNSTDLNSVSITGTTAIDKPTPVCHIRGVQQLVTQNVLPEAITAVVWPTAPWGVLQRQVDTLGQPLNYPAMMQGIPILPSNRLNKCLLNLPSSDYYQGMMGNFNDVFVGMRRQLTILPITERYVDQNLLAFFAYQRLDVKVFRYGSLVSLDYASTSS
jgi:HK97 family phage major capsid protein